MSCMSCEERDRIILAFALAMNEGNSARSDLEFAANEAERSEALHMIESARAHILRLRVAVLEHCQEHGC
jgi:hypothetical protein